MELNLIVALVTIILVIFGIAIAIISCKCKNTKKSKNQNYYGFFILGICFFPIGILFSISTDKPGFLGITALGVIYIIIGLKNKDKWKV